MISSEVIQILNDLITLNKNRLTGYKEAVHKVNDEKIADHCREMIKQGENNVNQLSAIVEIAGGSVEDKTTTSGLIYNLWMDIVYAGEKESQQDIYDYCRRMEKSTVEGYDALLRQINKEDPVYQLAEQQEMEIQSSLHKLDMLLK